MKIVNKIVLVCGMLCPCLVNAEEQQDLFSLSLEELLKIKVVVGATGYEQKLENAPATVSIIQREEWEAMGISDLYEVLATVAGVHIGLVSDVTEIATIVMRGLGGRGTQVKVLIDGQAFGDRTTTQVKQLGKFSLSGYKRIEVIKGPGSVVYGSDAFAGIVNLVSEPVGSAQNNHLTLKTGSYNAQYIGVTQGGEQGGFKWHFSAQHDETDLSERVVIADAQTAMDLLPFSAITASASNAPGFLQDWYDVQNFRAKLAYQAFTVDLFHWQSNFGIALGVIDRLDDSNDPVSHTQEKQSNVKLAYQLDTLNSAISGALALELTFEKATVDNDFMIFPEGGVVLVGDDGNLFSAGAYPAILIDDGLYTHTGLNTDVVNVKLNHVFRAGKQHGIRWEAGFETLKMDVEFVRMFGPGVTDSISLPRPNDGAPLILGTRGSGVDLSNSPEDLFILPRERDFWFFSFQDEWTPTKELNISLGIRHDKYSDFGRTTNPRVGVNWQASDKLTLKIFSGTAFRAPAFSELDLKNNTLNQGNKNLAPETINTSEIGFNYDLSAIANISLSGTWYQFTTDNIIKLQPDTKTGKLLTQNSNGEKGKGIELEALWKPLKQLTFRLNYAKSSLRDEITQVQRTNIPDTLLYLNANWALSSSLNWNLGIKSVAGRKRASGDTRKPIDDYTALTTRLSWKNVMPGLTLAVSGSNITDTYISEPGPQFLPRDIPMSGAIFKAEVRVEF